MTHKLERLGVVHDLQPGTNSQAIARVTSCEWESLRYPAEELTPVSGQRVTTCVACLGFRWLYPRPRQR